MEFSKIKNKSFTFLAWNIKTNGKQICSTATDNGIVIKYIYKHRRVEILEVQNVPMRVQCGELIKVRNEN